LRSRISAWAVAGDYDLAVVARGAVPMRARELGIQIGAGSPGPLNAITDVAGVRVGHTTLIEGDGPLRIGRGPVRTGVTVVFPHDGKVWEEALFAGCHRLNGNGELTGLEWVRESGMLTSAIGLTNTHSVGVVHDALIAHEVAAKGADEIFWGLPVVGETWDGSLNDINGFHVKPEHVARALAGAAGGPVTEGSVGGGTGMICHGFKGGIGTASRVVPADHGGFTVGVLVQANHGRRARFQVDGVPVGQVIGPEEVPLPGPATSAPARGPGAGSIIVVVATDAPLLPNQCERLAQRAGLGVARTGGVGEHSSGDLFLAFASGNRGLTSGDYDSLEPLTLPLRMLTNSHITPLFDAVVEATEEAIVNAMLQAGTLAGRDGITAHGLDGQRLVEVMRAYARGPEIADR
jgi:D-aminopeptidase